VIGWGKPYDTEIGLIQRTGRAGRSFHILDPDGTLHVPPKELDTLHVVTHEVHGNGSPTFAERHNQLISALQFFADPHSWRSTDGRALNEIPTFRAWLDGEVGTADVVLDEEDELVDGDDTAKIVDYLAKINRTGGPIREPDLLKHCKAEHSQARRKRRILRRAEELFGRDDERVRKVRRALGLDSAIEFGELMALSVVEKPDLNLEPVKAVAYMQNMSGGEKLEEMANALAVVKGTGYAEEVLTGYCVSNAPVYRGKSYFEREAPKLTNSSVLDRASEVASVLTRRFPSQLAGRQGEMVKQATRAIRMKLGLQGSQKLEKGGQFDVPAVFLELGEPRHMREIQGFVLRELMTPDLERVLATNDWNTSNDDDDF
jgi:hypothetical protein